MTSMDMHGFSITLAPADDDVLAALRAPVDAVGWPGVAVPRAAACFAPELSRDAHIAGSGRRDGARGQAIGRIADCLVESQEALDALDARVGDGDAGSTFASGARALQQALARETLSTGEDAVLSRELAALIERSMGGSSGVLLSLLFTAAARALERGQDWPQSLGEGVARMQACGGAKAGDRTMLDALLPAVAALAEGKSPAAASQAARAGADGTAALERANAGRSAAVRAEALRGVVDPGAEAVARAFQAWIG